MPSTESNALAMKVEGFMDVSVCLGEV
jgi:hypothetical protein